MKKIATILALAAAVLAIAIGCKKLPEFGNANSGGGNTPTVTTLEVSGIGTTYATCEGSIEYSGNTELISIGFCWSEKEDPTIEGSHTSGDAHTGQIKYPITGLTSGTTYYIRAYATNVYGIYYGNVLEFTTLEDANWTWYSPEPDNGRIPTSVLPEELNDSLSSHFTYYTGLHIPAIDGQFVSSPHVLIYSTITDDSVNYGVHYNDKFLAFAQLTDYHIDFYSKQWNDDANTYYEEAYRNVCIIGRSNGFTCYYITEGYPDGLYAKQSTILSGMWKESYGGIQNFQVAVILLETSGNPNLAPVNSFRVLCDGDSLARDTIWLDIKASINNINVSKEDAFNLFRIDK